MNDEQTRILDEMVERGKIDHYAGIEILDLPRRAVVGRHIDVHAAQARRPKLVHIEFQLYLSLIDDLQRRHPAVR